MWCSVTHLNKDQADNFIRKHMQDNIKVVNISKDDEDEIYFVMIKSGKLFHKVETSWQYRPTLSFTDQLLGSNYIGLCFGSFNVPFTNKRLDFYEFNQNLLQKANNVVWNEIQKWEAKSPY